MFSIIKVADKHYHSSKLMGWRRFIKWPAGSPDLTFYFWRPLKVRFRDEVGLIRPATLGEVLEKFRNRLVCRLVVTSIQFEQLFFNLFCS